MTLRGHRGWRALGLALLAGALLPLHRLLDPARGGPAAAAARSRADEALAQAWTGTAAVLAISALVVALVGLRMRSLHETAGPVSEDPPPDSPHGRAREWEAATTRGLTAISVRVWVWLCAAVAGLATAAVGRMLLHHRPTLADELVQLRHARLLARGALADGWTLDPAFRNSVNGVWTADGWASIYPPGHTAVLALATRIGILEWIGPVLTAATVGLTAAVVIRLLDDRPTTARIAGAAVALSPFLWGLGAGYLSHTSAACAVALAVWSAVRARDGAAGWAVLTGVAAGWAVTARPWTGLALAVVLPLGLWVERAVRERARAPVLRLHRPDESPPAATFGMRSVAVRAGAACGGGAPFAVLLALWNAHLFGAPLRFGYTAAFGSSHGLGLHRDPWGNIYGLAELIGYTGADLGTLGARLFETPVPAVAAVGAWLLLRGRPFRGAGPLIAWALAAPVANAFYWHHGDHLGPRMLYEAAPAWAALTVLAVVGLGLPRGTLAPATPEERTTSPSPAAWGLVALARVAAIVAFGWALAVGGPQRLASWVLPPADPLPDPDPAPALVFVHGSWAGREAARLEAAGMRRDSIETALRRNDLCRVHAYAAARRAGTPPPPLDLEALPGSPPSLTVLDLSPGNRARVDPQRPWTAECLREARADARGTRELAEILSRTPSGGPDGRVVWVRDLGPTENLTALAAFPDRVPLVWIEDSPGHLESYEDGMRRLWGTGVGGAQAP